MTGNSVKENYTPEMTAYKRALKKKDGENGHIRNERIRKTGAKLSKEQKRVVKEDVFEPKNY